ncbi:hypothetical protein HLH26_05755 [Gluconacetobacter sp. 1b LMG 1731]|uniref:DUF4393 domain-containing protein n=1 Tax=Gluconacetobacter dulcium TaxID=2729096 RepID=A0A7W4IJH9_9PROT|nr:hypothetical protein [Gluconacetobacter dulcium]MBB2164049.1 hypothetical protein [Gluconacetobacter dulcium]MBB2192753.1 hypothetical protein [Gluconacetobacter dulcium]
MDLQPIIDAATAGRDIVRLLPAGSKELAEQIVGAGSDTIRRWRQDRERSNLEEIAKQVRAFTDGLPLDEKASSKVAEQIIDVAKDEDREELQKLWAAMVARLMTGQLRTIRPEWMEIIKSLQEIDVAILTVIPKISYTVSASGINVYNLFNSHINEIWPQSSFSDDDIDLAFVHLESIKLISKGKTSGLSAIGHIGKSPYQYTTLGRKIVEITSPPTKAD